MHNWSTHILGLNIQTSGTNSNHTHEVLAHATVIYQCEDHSLVHTFNSTGGGGGAFTTKPRGRIRVHVNACTPRGRGVTSARTAAVIRRDAQTYQSCALIMIWIARHVDPCTVWKSDGSLFALAKGLSIVFSTEQAEQYSYCCARPTAGDPSFTLHGNSTEWKKIVWGLVHVFFSLHVFGSRLSRKK